MIYLKKRRTNVSKEIIEHIGFDEKDKWKEIKEYIHIDLSCCIHCKYKDMSNIENRRGYYNEEKKEDFQAYEVTCKYYPMCSRVYDMYNKED